MQYWPTFKELSDLRRNGISSERSEIRQGRYPQTDLSYIFIYIYELLCLIEISDGKRAVTQNQGLFGKHTALNIPN